MPTIRDVASRAKVSTATVSHVMNGTRPVAEATRARVYAAMKDLQFQPSGFARGLRQQTLKTIGLILGDFSDPFYSQIFQGVEAVAKNHGFAVMIASSDEDPENEYAGMQLMIQKGLNGVVIAPCPADDAVRDYIEAVGFPVVLIDRTWPNASVPSVLLHNREAAAMLVNLFVERGHRRILFVEGRPGLTTTAERREGYVEAMRSHDLIPLILPGGSVVQGGHDASAWWLAHQDAASAVICGNNLMLMGFLEGLKQTTQPARPVVLAGVDNERWSGLVTPGVSVVEQPARAMGEEAARLLIRRIQEGHGVPEITRFAGRLVARDASEGM